MNILIFFMILGGKYPDSHTHHKYDISCRFFVDVLYKVQKVPHYFYLAANFFDEWYSTSIDMNI